MENEYIYEAKKPTKFRNAKGQLQLIEKGTHFWTNGKILRVGKQNQAVLSRPKPERIDELTEDSKLYVPVDELDGCASDLRRLFEKIIAAPTRVDADRKNLNFVLEAPTGQLGETICLYADFRSCQLSVQTRSTIVRPEMSQHAYTLLKAIRARLAQSLPVRVKDGLMRASIAARSFQGQTVYGVITW